MPRRSQPNQRIAQRDQATSVRQFSIRSRRPESPSGLVFLDLFPRESNSFGSSSLQLLELRLFSHLLYSFLLLDFLWTQHGERTESQVGLRHRTLQ